MTDVFFAPAAPRWRRYVAVGDSFTEGMCDAPPGSQDYAGWADRLAVILSGRRREARRPALQYANLAVRGRLLEAILTEQVPEAVAAEPDLISLVGGGNDLLRPGADPDALAYSLERSVRAIRAEGIDVLLCTAMDTRLAGPLLSVVRPKSAVFNAHLWSIARRTGAHVIDVWGLTALRDRRMWAQDRVHMSSLGHERVAQAALVALGLEPDDAAYAAPLDRPARQPLPAQLRDDLGWFGRDVYPWATRRLRRSSSGNARVAKRPQLLDVEDSTGR